MDSNILPTYGRKQVSFESGSGSWLKSQDGAKFLDLGSGIAVNVLGHSNPDLLIALKAQADKLWHTSNLYTIPNQENLAKVLCENSFADKVFFTNSGTEAIECAVKMARKYHHSNNEPNRIEIITFENSFHGRSLAAISASGSEKLTSGFGPMLPGFKQVPFNDLGALRSKINVNTAAILIEPIQGEGGINVPSDGYLNALKTLCNDFGVLLIFDEVQCGIGRTGKLFAYEYADIEPDIMTIAKGIGGGFPLGACLSTISSSLGMTVGTHGSTYGGNPLACAVGLEVLNQVLAPGFLSNVSHLSYKFKKGLMDLIKRYPNVFHSVRGAGLMLGLKCQVENNKVVIESYNEQLLIVPAANNVVRLLPPLNIKESEIEVAVSKLAAVAKKLR